MLRRQLQIKSIIQNSSTPRLFFNNITHSFRTIPTPQYFSQYRIQPNNKISSFRYSVLWLTGLSLVFGTYYGYRFSKHNLSDIRQFQSALVHYQRKQYSEAITTLEQLTQSVENHSDDNQLINQLKYPIYGLLIRCYYCVENWAQAIHLCQKLFLDKIPQGISTPAFDILQKLSKNNQTELNDVYSSLVLSYTLGDLHQKVRDFSQAEDFLNWGFNVILTLQETQSPERIGSLNSVENDQAFLNFLTFKFMKRLADIHQNKENHALSAQLYQRCLTLLPEKSPFKPHVLHRLASCFYHMNELNHSYDCLKKAFSSISYLPSNYEGRFLIAHDLAGLSEKLGKFSESEEAIGVAEKWAQLFKKYELMNAEIFDTLSPDEPLSNESLFFELKNLSPTS